MSRGQHAVGQYTRGWEVAGNFVAMARISMARHLLLSVVAGVLVGFLWMRSTLSETERAMLKDFIKCSAAHAIKSDAHMDIYASLGGEMPTRQAYALYREAFGGRTVMFLAKQWLQKAVLCVFVATLGFGWLLTRYGKRLSTAKHLRGAEIVDTIVEAAKKRRRAVWRLAGVGLLAGTLAMGITFTGPSLAWLDDFLLSAACLEIPAASHLFSLDGDGALVWFTGNGEPGFRPPTMMYQATRTNFGGSVLTFLLEWVSFCGAGVMLSAAVQIHFRKRKQAKESSTPRDLVLATIPIPKSVETYHFMVCGSPGSGKSTAIKNMLDQIRARGQKAVVYDCSGEYISVFFRPGHDILLNPLDSRSVAWTPWAEMRCPEDHYVLGRSLFPREGRDPFWGDAGAHLFASVTKVLQEQGRTTNKALADLLLRAPLAELHDELQGTAGARFLDPDAGPMSTNVLATVASKLGVWDTLTDAGPQDNVLSIKSFIEADEDRWLFLTSRQDQHEVIKPLLSMWCDIAANALVSLPALDERAPRKWVIFDEVGGLQQLPSLAMLLERGRKHGAAVVLGLQTIAQLRETYGHDGADKLASYPPSWLCLRSVEPKTADWLEQVLCNAEQEEVQESLSMGPSTMRDGVSLQHQRHVRPLVMSSELKTLENLTGFLKRPGDRCIYRVQYTYQNRTVVTAGFEDRHKLQKPGQSC